MTDEADPPAQDVEQARSDGYRKGLNLGLLTVAIPLGLLAALRTIVDPPRFEEIFKQVKVPMPVLTMLVVGISPYAAAALVLGAAVCGIVTRIRGHRRATIALNGAYLFLSLSWMTLLTVGLNLPMMSLFEGIGSRRP